MISPEAERFSGPIGRAAARMVGGSEETGNSGCSNAVGSTTIGVSSSELTIASSALAEDTSGRTGRTITPLPPAGVLPEADASTAGMVAAVRPDSAAAAPKPGSVDGKPGIPGAVTGPFTSGGSG